MATKTKTPAPVAPVTLSHVNGEAGPEGKGIPCYRCGCPLAYGVQDLIGKVKSGEVTATKLYYVHGDDDVPTCGDVLRPASLHAKDTELIGSWRRAVKAAQTEALAADGYVRVMFAPLPVRAGTPEHAAAEERAARLGAAQRSGVKARPDAPMGDGFAFALSGGRWVRKVDVAPAPAPAPVATAPAMPAMPAPPMPAMPPMPAAPVTVQVATVSGPRPMPLADARAMLERGETWAVLHKGVWVTDAAALT